MLQHVTGFPSFLRLDALPLCVYATFCLSFHLLGYVGCFHFVVVMNSAAMNTGVDTCR